MRVCVVIKFILLILVIGAGVSDVLADSRRTADSAEFPDDECLYPLGRKFCFTFYSTRPEDSAFALRHGATASGPYYGDQTEALANAAKYNTAFIYKVNLPCMAGKSFLKSDFVMPEEKTIIDETAAIIKAVRDNRHIMFWDIVPEELRYWRKNEMRFLELVSSTIRANDPHNHPIYMYEPCHRNAEALAKTVFYQDICAKGMYVEGVGMRDNRIWCRWSMEQELKAIAKANPAANPWIVLWMAKDAEGNQRRLIKDWCRHDAYMGLVMGGKGIQIWSGWRGRKGFGRDFDAYLKGYLSVAKDLNGPKNLAPVFLEGKKRNDVAMEITAGPKTLKLDYQKQIHEYPPVTYTVLVHGDKTYLFAVNSAKDKVTAVFEGLSGDNVKSLFDREPIQSDEKKWTVTFEPLAVRGFCLENAD